jgi:hypothetical protein
MITDGIPKYPVTLLEEPTSLDILSPYFGSQIMIYHEILRDSEVSASKDKVNIKDFIRKQANSTFMYKKSKTFKMYRGNPYRVASWAREPEQINVTCSIPDEIVTFTPEDIDIYRDPSPGYHSVVSIFVPVATHLLGCRTFKCEGCENTMLCDMGEILLGYFLFLGACNILIRQNINVFNDELRRQLRALKPDTSNSPINGTILGAGAGRVYNASFYIDQRTGNLSGPHSLTKVVGEYGIHKEYPFLKTLWP